MKQLHPDLLRAALTGYEFELLKVDAKIAEIRRQMNGRARITPTSNVSSTTRKRKPFSAETRRKMAAAQRRRWKKSKVAKI